MIKGFAFWFSIAAILLVLSRIFVYTSSQWQNVLPFANLPLHAVLEWTNSGLIAPIAAGGSYTAFEALMLYIPYYTLFVATYVGYGLIIDLIVWAVKKKRTRKEAA